MENFGKRLRVLIIKWKVFCFRENLAILDIMMPAAGCGSPVAISVASATEAPTDAAAENP